MAKPPISPILISDKATVTFSAEEGGKIRCLYPSWDAPRVVRAGQHLQVRAARARGFSERMLNCSREGHSRTPRDGA
jgi:hypothetical protein